MGPQRTQKQAPIANQNDAFGSGSRTRSKSATGQKKVPVGPPMTGSKSASHPQQPTASNKSTKARAPGPSQPTTISRHNFKMTLSYRTVTEEDEVGDRGPRSRKGLMSQTADTSSSIYRARYESRIADEMDEEETDEDEGDEEGGDGDEGDEEEGNEDEGDEEELGEVEMEEDEGEEQDDTQEQDVDEQVASGTEEQLPVPATAQKASHDLKHTPRRTNETSLNARAAKNKEIEKSLLIASEGKLHQDMLDIQPSDEMTQADRVRWDKISKELVTEMNTPSSYFGRLVRKMNGTHSSGRRGEDELAKEFAKFCNHVAERLACAVSGQSMKRVSGIFRFSGNRLMKDGEVPHPGSGEAASDNKLDIIVNGESTEDDTDRWWNHILTFGEVKLAPSWDLKDLLLGQILRYLRKILQNHPISGKNVCFSLCGHLLRLFESDPAGFSTSPAYSFKKPEDYEKIICAVALLSGPPCLVSEQWEPSHDEILSVQKADGQCVQYQLTSVKRLAISPVIWGSRTAAWSAVATRVGKVDHEKLPLIIKSTWLPDRLYSHELDILGHIDASRNRCLANESFVPLLPFPVGHAINKIPGSTTCLAQWRTANGRTRNSTMVTFCEEGSHVDQKRPTLRSHTRFHRSLTKTLGWLAKHGIHYRDLNNGNVLRTANGLCVLIDFGNARYLKRPRGQTGNQPVEAWKLSLDDARSGTLMFMARRIHALTVESDNYRIQEEEYNSYRLQLERPNPLTEASELAKLEEIEALILEARQELHNIHKQHCYIDDAEAQLYLMMQQTLLVTNETAKFEIMEDLGKKQIYWKKASLLAGTRLVKTKWSFFEDVALAFRRKVDATLKEIKVGLEAGTLKDSDGTAFDCENKCFDLLDEIWAAEEARQDEEDRNETV